MAVAAAQLGVTGRARRRGSSSQGFDVVHGSAEREAKSLHARTKKLDFKLTIGNLSGLPDQLMEPLVGNRTIAMFVNVDSVRHAWRLSVDQHAEFHRRSWRHRSHDEVKIARVKPVRDAAVGFVQFGGVALYRPIAGQCPIVAAQM